VQRDLVMGSREESASLTVARVSGSTNLTFDFGTDCLFCKETVSFDPKHLQDDDEQKVRTHDCMNT
jgi:hypothetical protein